MISKRLTIIFLSSLLLIYAHAIEEVLTGFQYNDSFVVFGAKYIGTTPEIFYWLFHIAFWVSLPTLFFLLHKKRLGLPLISVFGIIYFVELHHVIKGVFAGHYYPGMITALFYPVVGFFFWQELIRNWRILK